MTTHPTLLQRARAMRREPTEAERALWRLLRAKRLAGYKFRRQVPMGRYIADFVCHQYGLVVEADGGQHSDNAKDTARDAWFAANGFRTMRFWNNDVLGNPDGVIASILTALATPLPNPSPARGEGLQTLSPGGRGSAAGRGEGA